MMVISQFRIDFTNTVSQLRIFVRLKSIFGKNRLCNLGFNVPREPTPRQAVTLNKAEEELPPTSNVARANDIELQEITENVARSMENLIVQLDGESSEDLPISELLGLDKQLRSIRGSLRVEVAKKFNWKKESRKKSICTRKSVTIQNTMMGFEQTLGAESPSLMTTYQSGKKHQSPQRQIKSPDYKLQRDICQSVG